MMLLPLLDPAGSKERSCRRLKRRLYRSKVSMIVSKPVDIQWFINSHALLSSRVQTFCGTSMAMINSNPMALPFMDASTGRFI